MSKKVIISVTSDLVTDQRVHRTAITLHNHGYDVTVVGRKKKDSLAVQRPYKTVRFKLLFEKGPLFYITYNRRLFFYLLFHRADIVLANDLDTLLANYLVSRIKKVELYYDSHEYFTEVPELIGRSLTQSVWRKIEQWIFPRLKHVATVNSSIAQQYENQYQKSVTVIRNVPMSPAGAGRGWNKSEIRHQLNLPHNKKILLLQGAGINIGRGAEEAIAMMQYLDDCLLLIIGGGDVFNKLKQNASDKVRFIPKLPMEELRTYSQAADIGLSLDKDISLNYRYSLPNKLFDYIHAGLPVLASNLPEVKKIVEHYHVGMITNSHDPALLAEKVKEMLSDQKRFDLWLENLKLAAAELCWEKEQQKLLNWFGITS